MGVRESRDQTSQLIFSAPHPLVRQLPATWLTGFAVAVLTGGGFGLRLLLAPDLLGLRVWTVGALFISHARSCTRVWSGGSKLFEVVYFFPLVSGTCACHSFARFHGCCSAVGEYALRDILCRAHGRSCCCCRVWLQATASGVKKLHELSPACKKPA